MAKTRLTLCGVLLLAACARRSGTDAAPKPDAAAGGASTPVVTAPSLLSYEQRLGRDVYQRYCQVCHGETGGGDGFNAFNLDPRPRDFSEAAFQTKKSDADLADAVRRGGAGVGLTPLMPPWGRTLSSRQIDSVVVYLRTLRKSEESHHEPLVGR